MGCLWAAALSQSSDSAKPTLILRDDHALHKYPGHIQLLAQQRTAHTLTVAATSAARILHDNQPVQNLLVATKAQDALPALLALEPVLNQHTRIVLLQNGLRPQLEIARQFTRCAVSALSTSHGAWLQAPFVVVHAGFGNAWLGDLNETAAAALLINQLPAAAMNIQIDTNIHGRLWQKFAVNCALNGLTGLYDCLNGELLSRPDRRQRLIALCHEIEFLLAELPGAMAPLDLQTVVMQTAQVTADNQSSTLQDLRNGRRTEIRELNGYLCALAEQNQLPCPLNRQILDSIILLESSQTPRSGN
jgi:2-dehydropantoate 2-reductase